MRSDSSTCAGSPEPMRPATYLTSGEYATTKRSRARSSPVALYRLQRSWSSIALTLVSSSLAPVLAAKRADASLRMPAGVAPTLPECKPESWRCWRGRAAPGSPAGRRRPPEDGWRRSGAGRADGRLRAPERSGRPAAPTCAAAAGCPTSPAAGRTWRETAPGRRRRSSAGRARARYRSSAAQRVLARRDQARLVALALHADGLGVEVDARDVEGDELLGAQAAGVGELEQRPVAHLERTGRRDAVQQRRHLGGLEHPRQPLGALGGAEQLGGVLAARAERSPGGETARAARPACAPPSWAPGRTRSARPRSGAGARTSMAAGASPRSPAQRANWWVSMA